MRDGALVLVFGFETTTGALEGCPSAAPGTLVPERGEFAKCDLLDSEAFLVTLTGTVAGCPAIGLIGVLGAWTK